MAKTNLKEQTCRVLKLICNGHDKHSSDGHGKKTQRTMAKNAFSCHEKKHSYKTNTGFSCHGKFALFLSILGCHVFEHL